VHGMDKQIFLAQWSQRRFGKSYLKEPLAHATFLPIGFGGRAFFDVAGPKSSSIQRLIGKQRWHANFRVESRARRQHAGQSDEQLTGNQVCQDFIIYEAQFSR
jgi:hypothetical protein